MQGEAVLFVLAWNGKAGTVGLGFRVSAHDAGAKLLVELVVTLVPCSTLAPNCLNVH